MKDLTKPGMIKLKGGLFVVLGVISGALLIIQEPAFKTALLLALTVWSFCRAYYFAFYVIEHYVDPAYKFSGLWSFVKYMIKRKGD
jgi:hypothetical protein